ncbi:hypothetical protein BN2476_90057 [Paraburkholderia piptadeniae]|uniref:Uncharacterized protein n=1 Tax=Paraburkholderia piptadeniae TaxID=1701573 RepID=A0A1N7RMQ4_9BURK|nr:hypothetical protein BN2476_90057 [Paraburkholderia piptadeniae]
MLSYPMEFLSPLKNHRHNTHERENLTCRDGCGEQKHNTFHAQWLLGSGSVTTIRRCNKT